MVELRKLSNENVSFSGPHEGVPSWLRGSAWEWVRQTMPVNSALYLGKLLAHERASRIELLGETASAKFTNLKAKFDYSSKRDGETALDIINVQLRLLSTGDNAGKGKAAVLEAILAGGGSAWEVYMPQNNEQYGLMRRVDPNVVESARKIASGGDDAAALFTKAWRAAFTRDNNPSYAYRDAVAAVEAAIWPVVSPADNSATLGTMIKNIQAKPEKWAYAIAMKPAHGGMNGSVIALSDLMQMLWDGHTDRHGTANPVVPSQQAAESAIMIAMKLISSVNNGSFSLKP